MHAAHAFPWTNDDDSENKDILRMLRGLTILVYSDEFLAKRETVCRVNILFTNEFHMFSYTA